MYRADDGTRPSRLAESDTDSTAGPAIRGWDGSAMARVFLATFGARPRHADAGRVTGTALRITRAGADLFNCRDRNIGVPG